MNAEMNAVRDRFAAMSKRCRDQLGLALRALRSWSKDTAVAVQALDARLDEDEKVTDELILRTLALRHPVASDLRMLTACFKLVTDLERIGDEAVNIADAVIAGQGKGAHEFDTLIRLSSAVDAIVAAATTSFLRRDDGAAQGVLAARATIEDLYAKAMAEMIAFVSTHPGDTGAAMAAMNAARALGRIAAHAANVAEGTCFVIRDERMPR